MAISNDDLPSTSRTSGMMNKYNPMYWERQHKELTNVLSKVMLNAKALAGNDTAEKLQDDLKSAKSEGERLQIINQLESIDKVNNFLSGEVSGIMNKIMDREKVSDTESALLLDSLNNIGWEFDNLANSSRVSAKDVTSTQADQMHDYRIGSERKSEIARNFSRVALSSQGDSAIVRELLDTVGVGSADQGTEERVKMLDDPLVQKRMDKFFSKINNVDQITNLMDEYNSGISTIADLTPNIEQAIAAVGDGNTTDEELRMSLGNLVSSLDSSGGVSDHLAGMTTNVSTLLSSEKINRDELTALLTKMNADTTPERSLFTLNQINENLEDGLNNDAAIVSAIQANNISQDMLESASKISQGGQGMINDIVNAALGVFGMGGLSELFDVGGAITGAFSRRGSRRRDRDRDDRRRRGGDAGIDRDGRRGSRNSSRNMGRMGGRFSRILPAMGAMGGAAAAGGGGGMMRGAGALLKGAGKFGLKFLGPLGLMVSAGLDAYDGFMNASKIMGIDEKDLTMLDKIKAGGYSIASGLTFGLLSPEDIKGFADEYGHLIGGPLGMALDAVTNVSEYLLGEDGAIMKAYTSMTEMVEKAKAIVTGYIDKFSSMIDSVTEFGAAVGDTVGGAYDSVADTASKFSDWVFGEDKPSTYEQLKDSGREMDPKHRAKMEKARKRYGKGTASDVPVGDSVSVTNEDVPVFSKTHKSTATIATTDSGEAPTEVKLTQTRAEVAKAKMSKQMADMRTREEKMKSDGRAKIANQQAQNQQPTGAPAPRASTSFNDFGLSILSQQVF